MLRPQQPKNAEREDTAAHAAQQRRDNTTFDQLIAHPSHLGRKGNKSRFETNSQKDVGPAIERTRPYIGDWWRTGELPFGRPASG